jgi:acetyl esterase/lipase
MKAAVPAVVLLSLSLPVLAQRNYPPEIEGAKVRVYKEASGTTLKLWAFYPEDAKPSEARPAIIFFFGGGWKSGSPMQFVPQSQHLARQGMVAMVADYRVASRHQTKAKDCVADARDAMRYVRIHAKELGIDPERVAAGGGSAGGHIAACLGTIEDDAASKPNAMALFNPACVMAPVEGIERSGEDRSAEIKERMGVDPVELSPYHHVTADAPPCVVFHGTADATVPYLTAELFAGKMNDSGVKCVLHGYEGEGHGFFNAPGRSKKGKEPAFPKTMRHLDAFFTELGWLH